MIVLKIIFFILTIVAFWMFKKTNDFRMQLSGIGAMVLFIVFSLTYFTPISLGNIFLLISIIISIYYMDNKEKQAEYGFPIWLLALLAYEIVILFLL